MSASAAGRAFASQVQLELRKQRRRLLIMALTYGTVGAVVFGGIAQWRLGRAAPYTTIGAFCGVILALLDEEN